MRTGPSAMRNLVRGTTALRWLLDPLTGILAVRLHLRGHGLPSFDATWRLARVTRHPDELAYRLHDHFPTPGPKDMGQACDEL